MLDALRRGAESWVLKPLLLLLVLAFIVWGVADVFTGARSTSVASVGSAEISADEFQATYGAVMNNFARRFGRRPTAEEARLRGIDRAVLEDMINASAVDQHISRLGLSLPQSAIIAAVEKDTGFQGPDGRFDRSTFEGFLREIGFNERGYLALRRREELREQLTKPLFGNVPASTSLTTFMHNWLEETRTVQYFTVDPATQVKLGEPTEEQLRQVYASQKGLFVTPEFRHIGVVVFSLDDIKKRIEVPEADIKAAYDQDRQAREIPERRRVMQIPFKDKAAAEAAAKAIAAGKSFMDVAKEAGATEKDVDLGLVTRGELLDPAIAAAAFDLAKDGVSPPVQGRFATFLIRVSEIQPARTRTLDDMRQELRDRLAATRTNEQIRKILDVVDDGRASGKPLKEIAAGANLTFIDVPQTDRQARDAAGKPAYSGPDIQQVMKAAFEGRPGVELEPVELSGGGYAWVDIIGVTESRERAYEDVKDDVRKAWQEQETARQIAQVATQLVERADKGETLTALAKDVGGRLMTSKPFKRFATDAGIPAAVVSRAFSLPLGARAAVDIGDGNKRVVFRLVEIKKAPPPTKEQADQIAQQMSAEIQQDAVQIYVGALRERYRVYVNEAAFRRTVGGDQR